MDEIAAEAERYALLSMASTGAHLMLVIAFLVFAIVVMRARPGGSLVIAAAALRVGTGIARPVASLLLSYQAAASGDHLIWHRTQLWIGAFGVAANTLFWVLLMVGLYKMLTGDRGAAARGGPTPLAPTR